MKTLSQIAVALLCSSLITPISLFAADYTQGSNIVKFQYKLASKGNAQAQYRLARMLETGDGIAVDLGEAKHWYDLSSKAGLKTAAQRNTYLKVKQQGFDAAADTTWLNGVKADAGNHKADAVLLLGQLYRQGLGVKKDLNMALGLFNEVRIRGVADVYEEIASINEEIDASNKALQSKKQALAAQKKRQEQLALLKEKSEPIKKAAILPEGAVKQLAPQKEEKKAEKKAAQAASTITAEQKDRAEKIKRYERAMLKLKQEQALIDGQQAGITGDAADDEI